MTIIEVLLLAALLFLAGAWFGPWLWRKFF